MKIAAVVVTYNRKEYLIKNIRALLAQEDVAPDILVVDNASTDGTRDVIEEHIKAGQIIYRNTGENLGGAGGFNYGIRAAYEMGYDYFWLMDDDTYPNPDALKEILQAHRDLHGDYGFLSGKALWRDGTPCKMNIQKYKKGLSDRNIQYALLSQATFVSLFISGKMVEEFGLPIKEFFIWGDDIEYTRRISAKRSSYLVESSTVLHDTKDNVGSDIVYDNERLERYRYAYRNEMYTALKEGWKRRVYQRLKIWYHIAKILLFSQNKKQKIQLIVTASREGRRFHPEIEYVK